MKLKEYNDIIMQQEGDGIIEGVDRGNITEADSVHYIPHRAVEKSERETTKTRIVFDGSAKRQNQPSLNECL